MSRDLGEILWDSSWPAIPTVTIRSWEVNGASENRTWKIFYVVAGRCRGMISAVIDRLSNSRDSGGFSSRYRVEALFDDQPVYSG
jgi:hypothetical protein